MSNNLAVVVAHPVTNFDHWKRVFDTDMPGRKAAGVLGHHLNRGADDPNMVYIFMPVTDRGRVEAFMANPDLKETMARAGVTAPPQVTWLERIDANYVGDRSVAAAMIAHEVADFDAWKKSYDAAQPLRDQAGIIGHAVNRVVGNPKLVLVYHQAETRAALEAFVASADLKAVMQRAGVTSAPQINFVQAQPGALY